MSSLKKLTARQLRREIGELSFPYYVRVWRDGEIWLGAQSVSGTAEWHRREIEQRLTDIGYRHVCNGKPGTAGANIVELKGRA